MAYADKLSSITGRPVSLAEFPLTATYPRLTLRREALKAVAGISVCAATLIFLQPAPLIGWPVAATGLLFAIYLGEQGRRARIRFQIHREGLVRHSGPRSTSLAWNDIQRMRLQFYPHKRRSPRGTLVLQLQGATARMKLDSTLEDFATVLLQATQAARSLGLQLDPTTETNLAQLEL